jgi:hypothetical protein
MSIDVTDVRSNPQDQIAHAATVIGRSEDCRKVFSAIYQDKKKIKAVSEIVNMTSLPRVRVLQEAGKLGNNDIVKKTKVGKELAYEKYPFYTENKNKVLKLAGNKESLEKFPTKTHPRITELSISGPGATISISFPKKMADANQITVNDIDSFAKVKNLSPGQSPAPIEEKKFKQGMQKILGEQGTFQDWGGELDDLFSTRLILYGKRKNVAFGFKGKGTTGILTPNKMGKRGDQIQRLFRTPADVFLVQYWGQIDESIIEQMRNFATAKSAIEGRSIYYGIIDGQDTIRILEAYPECFQ